MTPHISAPEGSFAADVLMPGDPLRARHIAQTYFDNPELVTAVRGIEGYTGTHEGRRMSVLASGMGIPSICIYATELFRHYGVERIIRVGTCGALDPQIGLNEIIVGSTAATDSAVSQAFTGGLNVTANASPRLVAAAGAVAQRQNESIHIGQIFTSDLFYHPDTTLAARYRDLGILALEMEAAGLYHVAASEHREALAIVTVSDLLNGDGELTTEERETGVGDMVTFALQTIHEAEHAE